MAFEIILRSGNHGFGILEKNHEIVFSADPDGRLFLVHTPETSYRRSRFNVWYRTVRHPWPSLQEVDPQVIRTELPRWAEIWHEASLLISDPDPLKIMLANWLDHFDEFHEADAALFTSVYQKIPILPPDAYQALYVRIQGGCPWNQCAFCGFYKEDPYRFFSNAEFQEHLSAIRTYWKNSIAVRHGFFLGDANAVAVPFHLLVHRLEEIKTAFSDVEHFTFQSFIDYFAGRKRSAEDFRTLKNLGLSRLSLGVESGDQRLLQRVGKPMEHEHIAHLVREAHAAGISMNFIFLIGLGGRSSRDVHHDYSIDFIRDLKMTRTDRIYLSPLVDDASMSYASVAEEEGWENLYEEEMRIEMLRWQKSIRRFSSTQVSPYHIRQFIY